VAGAEARAMRTELRALADPDRAAALARYFKTGPGEYGEGDRFLGLRLPDVRAAARRHRDAPLADCVALLRSEWHEERTLALIVLVEAYRRGDEEARAAVVGAYLAELDHVNSWDLVDLSAPRILGAHLLHRDRALLGELAADPSFWRRRVAVVATAAFIAAGDFSTTFELAERLLGDPDDLVHKGVGWMLREVGKKDEAALVAWLDQHRLAMPRTMLRYAVERLPAAERARLMAR
jgi:3-methyladenine DNA glycosylase AlkD